MNVFQRILESIRNVVINIKNAAIQAMWWVWGHVVGLVNAVLDGLGLPDTEEIYNTWFTPVAAVVDAMNFANEWFPIWLAMFLIVSYYGVYMLILPIKFFLRHLPYVGGAGDA